MAGKSKHILFLHIQKTAGTTLHQIFYNNFRGYVSFDFKRSARLRTQDLKHAQKWYPYTITGIGGHQLDWDNLRTFFKEDPFMFTVLREPIERYLSFYHHLNSRHDLAISMDDYLAFPMHFNFQTKAFSSKGDLDEAITNMDKFDLVGIFEDMPKTLSILQDELGIDCSQKDLNHNKRKRIYFHDLTREQQELCRQNNALDLQLYKHAKKNFKLLDDRLSLVHPKSSVKKWLSRLKRKWSLFYINKLILRGLKKRQNVPQNP